MAAPNDLDRRRGPEPGALAPSVSELSARFTAFWNEPGEVRPDLGPSFSRRERRPREKALARFVDSLRGETERLPLSPEDREACQKRIFRDFERFARAGLGWEDRHIETLLGGGFERGASDFVRMAGEHDPALASADVFQACRNVWVANGVQRLLGLPVRLTPSVFAYSLLYPYTDNYLDDPAASDETKKAFNARLRSRLEGEDVPASDPREKAIFDLVAMIEGEHDRALFPQVFDSLVAIHEAQVKSLRLLAAGGPPAESDIIGIVLEKGGTSVLADGCLVAGALTPDQVEFLFGFGAFLQVMDDLEDVVEDRRAGLWTAFSRQAALGPLDGVTDRALRFGGRVLSGLDRFSAPGSEPLRELIRSSLPGGLISTAGRFGKLYRRAYLKELERHSPFRFAFYNRQRRRLERRRAAFARLFESLAKA